MHIFVLKRLLPAIGLFAGAFAAVASVPAEYLQVEYLESSGTQYIDTGIVIQQTDGVTATYRYLTHPSGENWVFASWNGNGNLRCGINASGSYCGHADMTVTTDLATGWSTATRTSFNAPTSGYTDYLYAQHGYGAPGHLGCSIQIKSYTVTRGGATAVNLVPCVRVSDRVCGFYETESGDFLTNAASGADFTPGPMVAPGTGKILVAGNPYDLGTATPAYGVQAQASGASSFSLAGTEIDGETWYLNEAGDRRGKLTGHEMVCDNTNVVASGASDAFTCTVPAAYDALKLTWSFDTVQVKVSASGAGGSVTVGGEAGEKWCASGETVSLRATPEENYCFYKWTGSGVTSANEKDNPLSITVGANPMTPTPVFSRVLYVSASGGDDTDGDGTPDSPYATISKALAVATSGSEIRVRGGLYEENLTDATLDGLAILGGYDGSWSRDLKGSPTIVRAATANQPVVDIQGDIADVRLGGLVLTGGSYGIRSAHLAGMVFEQLVISNNTSYAIGFSDNAFDKDRRMAITSCLFAYNKGGIQEIACGWVRPWYMAVYSCTFLETAQGGAPEWNVGYGEVTFRNNVFMRKGGVPTVGKNSGNFASWYYNNCVAGGSPVEELYPQSVKEAVGNIYDAQAGVNDDGTLSDASPCLKVGGDLSEDPNCPVPVDLYGNAWNGKYDMGAIKSPYEPYVPRDIHVATDGDDETGDGTAEKPYASISRAIGVFKAGDRVLVQGGVYAENVSNTSVDGLEVLGSYDANWERDLKNCRTVIVAADAARPALSIDGAWRNHWSGFDLTGGNYGLSAIGNRDHVFEQMAITNNTSSGICEGPASGDVALTSYMIFANLLVANNGAYAINPKDGSWQYPTYWYNCTFVGNKSGVLWGYGVFTLRNCICYNPDAESEFGGTGNTQLDIGACCVRDALYGNCQKTVQVEPETITVDPKLDASFRLTDKSLCNKRGQDLSSLTTYASTEDAEGSAWSGGYDMGCFKSAYPWVPGIVRLKDVYVSADGDDENDGSAEHPVATILQGLNLTDAGGTCHVGPGGFRGGVTLERCDMTLVGSGMGATVVTDGSITIAAHGGTVRDLSLFSNGKGTGLVISQKGMVTNATVACCEIAGWGRGVEAGDPNEQEWDYSCNDQIYRFSHLVVTNCGVYSGVYARGRILIDNCLLASNNSPGLYVYSGAFRAYNCTFADNSGKAVCGPGYDTRYDRIFVNCIFSGSDIAYVQDLGGDAGRKSGEFSNCLVNCTHFSYNERLHCDESVVAVNDCVFGQDPQFRTSARKRYHVGGNSPAHQTGLPLEAVDDLLPPSTQTLDGKARGRFWDMGCYNDPTLGLSILVR